MLEIYRAAHDLQSLFDAHGWRYCLIGGLALQRWGEPRETIDVDMTLLTGVGQEEPFVRAILSKYSSRVADPIEFAVTNRVVLAQTQAGVGLDIALGFLPFEEAVISRASRFEFAPGLSLLTASAEDIVVLKAFASRPKDWVDIEGIVIRQAGRLDWQWIENQLVPLAEIKGEPEILPRLEKLKKFEK